MSGTKEGGRKAAATNKERHGDDFFASIGSKGGRNGHTGGFFAMDPKKRSECGRKGGHNSSRKGVKNGQRKEKVYHRMWGE